MNKLFQPNKSVPEIPAQQDVPEIPAQQDQQDQPDQPAQPEQPAKQDSVVQDQSIKVAPVEQEQDVRRMRRQTEQKRTQIYKNS